MKRLIFGLFVLSFVCSANAIVVQKVMLKNGSVLYGYIQQQDGTGKLQFHTDSATICVDGDVVEISTKTVNINSLSQQWKDWALNNNAYQGSGDDKTFVINNISFIKDSVAYDLESDLGFQGLLREKLSRVSDVKVLENGVTVKYLELSPNTYTISWKDVVFVQSARRPKTALSGINRSCTLKNGQIFVGQYAEETENLLKLYLSDGLVQSFKIEDVVKSTYRGINPKQDIFAQGELLDIAKTKSQGEVKGVIIEQNYESAKGADNYFVIQQTDNSTVKVKVSDIVELRKEENPKYSPKFDILLKPGEVRVNRKEVKPVKVTEYNDFLQLDSINGALVVEQSTDGKTRIVVEYRSDAVTSQDVYQLVAVAKQIVKKENVYGFTYKDLVNATIRANSEEVSVNHTAKSEFVVEGKGIFALYDSKSRKAIPIRIK